MGLGCGAKVLKYCLFAFNLVFVIGGLVCLGVGIWLIADKHAGDTIDNALKTANVNSTNADNYVGMPNAVRNLGIVLAVGGGIILVIAFLGCCGAVKEWRPLLVLYAIFLIIILGIEIAAAVYTAVNKDSIDKNFQDALAESFKLYGGNDSYPNPVRTAWDAVMNTSQCCGVDPTYPNDRGFHVSQWFTNLRAANNGNCPPAYDDSIQDSHPYPVVCCRRDNFTKMATGFQTCGGFQYCTKMQIVDTGCYAKVQATLHNKMAVIIGVGITVGVVQLIGILFAFCLCCAIGQEQPQ